MPQFRSRLSLAAVAAASILATPVAALAGSAADCHRPPPAWYTAPRVSYTTTVVYGAGYNHAPAREYYASRQSSGRYYTHYSHYTARDRYTRW